MPSLVIYYYYHFFNIFYIIIYGVSNCFFLFFFYGWGSFTVWRTQDNITKCRSDGCTKRVFVFLLCIRCTLYSITHNTVTRFIRLKQPTFSFVRKYRVVYDYCNKIITYYYKRVHARCAMCSRVCPAAIHSDFTLQCTAFKSL